jgi:hypothetical protein
LLLAFKFSVFYFTDTHTFLVQKSGQISA